MNLFPFLKRLIPEFGSFSERRLIHAMPTAPEKKVKGETISRRAEGNNLDGSDSNNLDNDVKNTTKGDVNKAQDLLKKVGGKVQEEKFTMEFRGKKYEGSIKEIAGVSKGRVEKGKTVPETKEFSPGVLKLKEHFGKRYAELDGGQRNQVMKVLEGLPPDQARAYMDSYKVLTPEERKIYDNAGPRIVEAFSRLSPAGLRTHFQFLVETDPEKRRMLRESLSPEDKRLFKESRGNFSSEEYAVWRKIRGEYLKNMGVKGDPEAAARQAGGDFERSESAEDGLDALIRFLEALLKLLEKYLKKTEKEELKPEEKDKEKKAPEKTEDVKKKETQEKIKENEEHIKDFGETRDRLQRHVDALKPDDPAVPDLKKAIDRINEKIKALKAENEELKKKPEPPKEEVGAPEKGAEFLQDLVEELGLDRLGEMQKKLIGDQVEFGLNKDGQFVLWNLGGAVGDLPELKDKKKEVTVNEVLDAIKKPENQEKIREALAEELKKKETPEELKLKDALRGAGFEKVTIKSRNGDLEIGYSDLTKGKERELLGALATGPNLLHGKIGYEKGVYVIGKGDLDSFVANLEARKVEKKGPTEADEEKDKRKLLQILRAKDALRETKDKVNDEIKAAEKTIKEDVDGASFINWALDAGAGAMLKRLKTARINSMKSHMKKLNSISITEDTGTEDLEAARITINDIRARLGSLDPLDADFKPEKAKLMENNLKDLFVRESTIPSKESAFVRSAIRVNKNSEGKYVVRVEKIALRDRVKENVHKVVEDSNFFPITDKEAGYAMSDPMSLDELEKFWGDLDRELS